MINLLKPSILVLGIISLLLASSCKKGDNTPGPPSDICQNRPISVTGTIKPSGPCGSDGSITAAATGSTGFTFKLNQSGNFQSNPVFNNLTPGNYTLFARDADGCERSTSINLTSSTGTAGTLFLNVKTLMAAKCQSCHNNTIQNGGMNWQVECNIVTNQARIKARAVDIGDMPQGGPPLTTSEKAIITNWINAGGKFTD